MEPFDENLDKNIWALSDKRLKLDLEIAMKRRSKPQEIEESLGELYQRQQAADTEMAVSEDEIQDEDPDNDREYDIYLVRLEVIDALVFSALQDAYHDNIQEVVANVSASAEELSQVS